MTVDRVRLDAPVWMGRLVMAHAFQVETSGRRDLRASTATTIRSRSAVIRKEKNGWMHELWDNTKRLTHEAEKKAWLQDDWDFENEMERRPRELDDEETYEETEAADDKQQRLFDREAVKGARRKRSGIFW